MVHLLTATALAALALPTVMAAANMVPSYEIHLMLDPTACLGSDFELTPTVLSTFAMPTSVTTMNVQYLDTDTKDIYSQGWISRIRSMKNGKGFHLTYKKRYLVSNGDIDSALTQANRDGFDITLATYEAEIEWGYTSQTLSISQHKSASESGYGKMDLPSKEDSRSMLMNDKPDKFNNWLYSGWGTAELGQARIYGPILAKRSIGTWDGNQLYIEVWPMQTSAGLIQCIVEASFKTTNATYASTGHDALLALLQSKGWFLAQNVLKTELIMANY